MTDLKFRNQSGNKISKDTSSSCGSSTSASETERRRADCCHTAEQKESLVWLKGAVMTETCPVPRILTGLTRTDYLEHIRCRISGFRNNYIVPPGLYAIGEPDKSSEVLVSANYKLSFDALRSALKDMNVWVLVLDTKGINVWCAAGKGTFGSEELARRIAMTQLAAVVGHRRIIVPQLGAPGVSAHVVRQKTGFRVLFGPVLAKDISEYIRSGYKATRKMRTVHFPLFDRLILTPMEIRPALKWYGWFALLMLAFFGLQPSGIFFSAAWNGGFPYLSLGLVALAAGALFTPALLPFIPFRSFAVKGWVVGIFSVFSFVQFTGWKGHAASVLLIFTYLFFPMASSYIALQFTGSTTYTGMSGVKKELKMAMPVYFVSSVISLSLLVVYKLVQWSIL
jgi:hypothetical protein